jgi:hypothetical protein
MIAGARTTCRHNFPLSKFNRCGIRLRRRTGLLLFPVIFVAFRKVVILDQT